jgi:hypothetical protein
MKKLVDSAYGKNQEELLRAFDRMQNSEDLLEEKRLEENERNDALYWLLHKK